MIEVMDHVGVLKRHARLIEGRSAGEPAWIAALRSGAMETFTAMGFPTTRDEEWKFTSVAPIAKTSFELADEKPIRLTKDQIERFAIPSLNAVARLVFVNGRYSRELSVVGSLPRGVTLLPLNQAFTAHRAQIQSHLEGHVLHTAKADAFAWMNAAFLEDGVFLHVAKGTIVEQPIELLSIATHTGSGASGGAPIMSHPRNVIIADENAECTVIERYISLDAGVYFTNAVTDLFAGEHAHVHHYLLEEEGGEAFNISTLRTRQLRNSTIDSHTMLLGGKLVRNNVHAILEGEGAQCLINGLYIGSEAQHMDNHMRVEHAQPHGDSRQFYNGILNDKSTGVFAGRIIVHPGAQKTDAKQTNRNLLLSAESHVDTKPQLEIYADDVKCTHGATIGQLDEQAIFYCQARGISKDAARSLLIHAFAGQSLSRMKNAAMREYMDNVLFARLPGGDLLERVW